MAKNYDKDESSDPALKEIRDQYADDTEAWSEIREEGDKDMRYRAGDPWEEKDRKKREDDGRPCISLDILGQHLNKAINNVRQNKRDLKGTPRGDGANDKDAARHVGLIRGIEYDCKGQQAHICAFENAISRSYGFSEIATVDDPESDAWEQNIVIKRIPNPNTVLIDPNYQMADASDITRAFKLNLLSKKEYKRKYPKAKIKSFTREHARLAPGWIRENSVQVAAYWKVKLEQRTQYLIQTPQGPTPVFEDELPGRNTRGITILKTRRKDKRSVIQQVVNGIEIIDERKWAGSYIPIIGCFGAELFLNEDGEERRVLLSLIRLARDAQMLHAFLSSQECEEAGLTPKVPFIGYVGQFETDAEAWELATKVPRATLQADPIVDASTNQVLPLPTRPAFQPNFQAYEMAKDAAERSAQSALGIAPLPSAARRRGEKSGIAIEKMDTLESVGSYHFTDNYDNYLENCYRQIDELLGPVIDTPRDMPYITKEGKHTTIRVNDDNWAQQNPDKDHLHTGRGRYVMTISIGPNFQSEREEASDFLDTIIANIGNLPIPPAIAQKILGLAIKLKPTLGNVGETIADLLNPPNAQNVSPEIQAQLTQLQGLISQYKAEFENLMIEKKGKLIELQAKERIAAADRQVEISEGDKDRETKLAVASQMTKAQIDSERQALVTDLMKQFHAQAHDIASQAAQQAHERAMAQFQAAQQPAAAPAAEAQPQV